MKICGWECVVSADGMARGASNYENGCATWVHGRLIASGDVPAEVLTWLIRPQLRIAWDAGCIIGLGAPTLVSTQEAYRLNPYNGEPPNKDNDPS